MNLLIGIATYQRVEKLRRLLDSIYSQDFENFDVVVAFDNCDSKSLQKIKESHPHVVSLLMPTQSYVIGCWNKIHQIRGYDAHLTLCDDVELHPHCLRNAMDTLKNNFCGVLDGVVGLNQICPNQPHYSFQPTGQVLIGKGFLERFKNVDYQVCCPNYIQWYQDAELYKYCRERALFKFAEDAKLTHYHPCFCPEEMDSTHGLVRGNQVQKLDKEVWERRNALGLVWGESWDRI